LTFYYFYLFLLIFGLAFALPINLPAQTLRRGGTSVAIAIVSWAVAFGLISYTNLRVIQADIAFKTAELFAQPNSWPIAIRIYQRAINLAPNEDYYYLFLGRAYLEYAKTLQDANERDRLIQEASQELRDAQRLNPLNTDHTANLARLYSLWAAYTTDPTQRNQRAEMAEEYFSKAVTLSPRSARLWDEWAVNATNILHLPDLARQRLTKALEIDPYYDWTYALLADSYAREVVNTPDLSPEQKNQYLIQASDYYSRAFSLADPSNSQYTQLRYGYIIGLGSVQAQLGNLTEAIQDYEQALAIQPTSIDRWRVELVLAQLYIQIGDSQKAQEYAHDALASAPDDQKASVQALLDQMVSQP
jgi:tetratricopeptide (TPR) repeat protein